MCEHYFKIVSPKEYVLLTFIEYEPSKLYYINFEKFDPAVISSPEPAIKFTEKEEALKKLESLKKEYNITDKDLRKS